MITATAGRTPCEKRIYILPSNVATSLSPKYIELGHFTLFCRGLDGKEMHQDSKRTCTVIVLFIKPFVWCPLVTVAVVGFAKTPYCSVRDWTRFLRHRIKKKIRIHPSTRYRIRCGYIFFHFGERIYFFPDSLSNSPYTCGR